MKVAIVCSVKGGTGKTLVAVNLAHYLSEHGKTGLLDCDIDSSNFAEFVKPDGVIGVTDDKRFQLYDWNGVKVWSMSLIAEKWRPVSMTGDRHVQIVDDAIRQSRWDVDYLVCDMPPGASDIFKTVLLEFAESIVGSVIVIQPAFYDNARRVIRLHQINEIPIVGLIENMSYFVCEHGERYDVFGESIGERLAKEFGVKFLGRIPLSVEIRRSIERGDPILKGDYAKPVIEAAEEVVKAKSVGIVEKLKRMVTGLAKREMERVLAFMITKINREFPIRDYQERFGFKEERPFSLVITDEFGSKVLSRICMRIRDGKIKVIENPRSLDYEIVTDFRTLARIVMGRMKTDRGEVPYDVWDAWLNGQLKIYGTGHTPRAVAVAREILGNQELLGTVREKFGNVLSRFI